jgi:hypothetical protein
MQDRVHIVDVDAFFARDDNAVRWAIYTYIMRIDCCRNS